MGKAGVEVHRVAGYERVLLPVEVNVQPAFERVDELHACVRVQPDVVARHGKELGVVRV